VFHFTGLIPYSSQKQDSLNYKKFPKLITQKHLSLLVTFPFFFLLFNISNEYKLVLVYFFPNHEKSFSRKWWVINYERMMDINRILVGDE